MNHRPTRQRAAVYCERVFAFLTDSWPILAQSYIILYYSGIASCGALWHVPSSTTTAVAKCICFLIIHCFENAWNWLCETFCNAQKAQKLFSFSVGVGPRPRWGSIRHYSWPLSRTWMRYPLPFFTRRHLSLRASVSAPHTKSWRRQYYCAERCLVCNKYFSCCFSVCVSTFPHEHGMLKRLYQV